MSALIQIDSPQRLQTGSAIAFLVQIGFRSVLVLGPGLEMSLGAQSERTLVRLHWNIGGVLLGEAFSVVAAHNLLLSIEERETLFLSLQLVEPLENALLFQVNLDVLDLRFQFALLFARPSAKQACLTCYVALCLLRFK